MSQLTLQQLHDRIIKDGIGTTLPVMQELLTGVKAHLEQDATNTQVASLTAQVKAYEDTIADLQSRLASAVKTSNVEESVIEEALKYEQEHNLEPK